MGRATKCQQVTTNDVSFYMQKILKICILSIKRCSQVQKILFTGLDNQLTRNRYYTFGASSPGVFVTVTGALNPA
jgi:hypothetical protein